MSSIVAGENDCGSKRPAGPAERSELVMSVDTTTIAEAVETQHAPAELLFQSYKLGPLLLPHRIAMAPLTRSRARQPGNVLTALNAC